MIRIRPDLSRRRLPLASLAALALLLPMAAPLAAQPIEVDAHLVLPAGAETLIDASLSLPVLAIAELNLPVRKTAILAQLDKEKLEKELDGARKSLSSAQAEKRRLATDRRATTSQVTTNDRAALQGAQQVGAAEAAEQQAMSDMTTLTTQIAQTLVRAPEDGFLAKALYSVGAKTKKRKPFLVFAEVSRTVVEASVPAAQASAFAPGTKVRLASTAGDARGFQGKVVAATPEGDSVALKIQPLELPYFPLGSSERVAISPAP
jgi:multidrug resistance efflux pump